jgi:hypothetical protein
VVDNDFISLVNFENDNVVDLKDLVSGHLFYVNFYLSVKIRIKNSKRLMQDVVVTTRQAVC